MPVYEGGDDVDETPAEKKQRLAEEAEAERLADERRSEW